MAYPVLRASEYLQEDDKIIVQKASVDGCCPMHSHEFIEIAYIVSGIGDHTVNGVTDIVGTGDLLLLGSNTSHMFTSRPGKPLIVYNCLFQPLSVEGALEESTDFIDIVYKYLNNFIQGREASNNFIKQKGFHIYDIGYIMEYMHKEYTNKKSGYRQIIKSELIKLLILIFRQYCETENQTKITPTYQQLIVENTVNYLKKYYNQKVSCRHLAERAYLSPTHMSRIFKEITGYTIVQFLQQLRIEAACELLDNTNLSISEIASQVGYQDIKYFYRLFEHHRSLTPGIYRTQKIK
ncbi:MAG: AraC family transcriptional regulator [Mobilitalea sp.]